MIEMPVSRLWTMRGAFVALAGLILFIRLLPLQTEPPGNWIAPDTLFLFALAWAVRRPEFVPPVLLACVFLLADLLLQRPPGLWALMCLLACESLKSQMVSLRDSGWLAEYLAVAILILASFVGYWLVLALMVVEPPAVGLYARQVIMTLLFYPIVAFVTHWLMGVRRLTPADVVTVGLRG